MFKFAACLAAHFRCSVCKFGIGKQDSGAASERSKTQKGSRTVCLNLLCSRERLECWLDFHFEQMACCFVVIVINQTTEHVNLFFIFYFFGVGGVCRIWGKDKFVAHIIVFNIFYFEKTF